MLLTDAKYTPWNELPGISETDINPRPYCPKLQLMWCRWSPSLKSLIDLKKEVPEYNLTGFNPITNNTVQYYVWLWRHIKKVHHEHLLELCDLIGHKFTSTHIIHTFESNSSPVMWGLQNRYLQLISCLFFCESYSFYCYRLPLSPFEVIIIQMPEYSLV